jgi:hypothetical protein
MERGARVETITIKNKAERQVVRYRAVRSDMLNGTPRELL